MNFFKRVSDAMYRSGQARAASHLDMLGYKEEARRIRKELSR